MQIFEKRQNVDYDLRFQIDFVLPDVNKLTSACIR